MSVNHNNLLKYFIFYFLFLLLGNLDVYIILKINNQYLNFILITLYVVFIPSFFIYYKFQFIENKKLYNKMLVFLLIIYVILLWIELVIFNKFLFYFIILNLILVFLLFFILIIYSIIFHVTRYMRRTGDQSESSRKV
jgi:membrane-associated HD superfamily phosphohydrolase